MTSRPIVLLVALLVLTLCEQSAKCDELVDTLVRSDGHFASSLRQQIESNWMYDPGLPGIENWTVEISVAMNPDGTVGSALITGDLEKMKNDANYRKFAESARLAVLKSSPLKIPASVPYAVWKKIFLTFRIPY